MEKLEAADIEKAIHDSVRPYKDSNDIHGKPLGFGEDVARAKINPEVTMEDDSKAMTTKNDLEVTTNDHSEVTNINPGVTTENDSKEITTKDDSEEGIEGKEITGGNDGLVEGFTL
jgi:hypothetical protein